MNLTKEFLRAGVVTIALALSTVLLLAQPATVSPVRTAPTEKLTINAGFRDWSPITVAGTSLTLIVRPSTEESLP